MFLFNLFIFSVLWKTTSGIFLLSKRRIFPSFEPNGTNKVLG